MKHKKPQRLKGLEPFERRRDWVMFEGYAHMHVSIAGGPIHEPYEEAIQLFIIPWRGEYESWLTIPPITGPVLELTRKTRYRVRFWRGRWDSEFTWEGTAPKGWLPLARLFDALLKNVRGLASGNQLQPWKER